MFAVEIPTTNVLLDFLDGLAEDIQSDIVRGAITRTAQRVVQPALRRNIGRSKGEAKRKDGSPRKHLADSVEVKTVEFKDGSGWYTVTGPSDRQPHAWLYEHGSTLRFRKRIGGKFAYLEPLKSVWFSFNGEMSNIARARRTTGWMPAANILPKVKNETTSRFVEVFIVELNRRILRKAQKYGLTE